MNNIMNKWSFEEIKYLNDNYSSLDMKDLKYNLNRTESVIRKKAFKLNLTKRQFPWTEKEIEYLKNNYMNGNIDLLKLNLNNHSWHAIQIKAFRFGMKRKRLLIDEDFFKEWTPEMAYIFGFWIADGNMLENRNTISFASNDHDILNIIKSLLKSEHKISLHNNGFQLQIENKIIYDDLLKLGGIPRKSLIIKFPNVPTEYLSHFIRGEFDGDGSFYIHVDRRRIPNYKYLNSSFAGNIDFLTILKDKIKENANIVPTGLYHLNNCDQRIYQLIYNNKKAIALGDYIYKDSENLRLDRKYKIYKNMKKNI